MTLAVKHDWNVKIDDVIKETGLIRRSFMWLCACGNKRSSEKICADCFTWRPDFVNSPKFWEPASKRIAGDVVRRTEAISGGKGCGYFTRYTGPKFVASLSTLATSVVLRNIPKHSMIADC